MWKIVNSPINFGEPKEVRLVVVAIIIVLFQIVVRYSGNANGFYAEVYQFLISEGHFEKDIYLQNTFLFSGSSWWGIIDWLNLNLDNDIIGLAVHGCLSVVAVTFVYRIISHFLTTNKVVPIALLTTVFMLFTDFRILSAIRTGMIYTHTLTQTHVAFSLSFIFFYLLIQKRHAYAVILLTAILSLNPAVMLPLVFIGLLTVGFGQRTSIKDLAYYLLPFLYLAYKSIAFNESEIQLDAISLERAIQFALGNTEFSFNAYPLSSMVLYLLTFFVYYKLMLRYSSTAIYPMLKAVLIVGIVTLVFAYFYAWIGHKYFPNVTLASIYYPRGSKYLVFFLFLMVFISIFLSDRVGARTKLIFSAVYLLTELPRFTASPIGSPGFLVDQPIWTLGHVVFFSVFLTALYSEKARKWLENVELKVSSQFLDSPMLLYSFGVFVVNGIILIQEGSSKHWPTTQGWLLILGLNLCWLFIMMIICSRQTKSQLMYFPRLMSHRLVRILQSADDDFANKGIFPVLLIVLLMSSLSMSSYLYYRVNLDSLRYFNKWTMSRAIDDHILPTLLELRKEEEDFVLITYTVPPWMGKESDFLTSDQLVSKAKYGSNAIALKSKYTGHYAHVMLNQNLVKIHDRRTKIQKQLNDEIAEGVVSVATLKLLSGQDIRILIPKKFRYVFPAGLRTKEYRDWILIFV
jgi:hypothetical protein